MTESSNGIATRKTEAEEVKELLTQAQRLTPIGEEYRACYKQVRVDDKTVTFVKPLGFKSKYKKSTLLRQTTK